MNSVESDPLGGVHVEVMLVLDLLLFALTHFTPNFSSEYFRTCEHRSSEGGTRTDERGESQDHSETQKKSRRCAALRSRLRLS
jgi:hypothetical protein